VNAVPVVLVVIGAYVCLLFGIALRAERVGVRRSGLIYTLSLGVYCTSWTFYGSVGRAAHSGVDFLPVYLGPTLVFCLGGPLLARMIRVSKASAITSIADFVSTRYGRSARLAGLVTLVMLAGSVPYIALQLQAVAESLTLVLPPSRSGLSTGEVALATAVLLGVFAILFGARHTDLSAHRPGLVAAIAFHSVVKLACLTAVGLFVGVVLFDGFGDLFARATARPDLAGLARFAAPPADWTALMLLSMAAAFCLPRQFHMMVVENRREADLAHAIWGFPLYLLLINLFVLPIALAGALLLPAGHNADMIVLDLPLNVGASWLAVLAFVGGVSAATGMVAVETLALGTMVSNDLVMPALLRLLPGRMAAITDLTPLLLAIRRASIVLLLLLGLLYMRIVGDSYALVSIGLVSFAAAAQLAPAILFGLFWSGARAIGAGAGIAAGTLVWTYTLFLPSLARSGLLPDGFLDGGLFGLEWTRPYALLGLGGLDPITHTLFWSMLANVGLLIGISVLLRPSPAQLAHAMAFIETSRGRDGRIPPTRVDASSRSELIGLVGRFIGPARAAEAFDALAREHGLDPATAAVDRNTVQHAERLLAGVIGGASARVLIASAVHEAPLGVEELLLILDESSQLLRYSHRLEEQSRALQATTQELRRANESLQELDHLKDEFVATVSHELRTPLTSIRSFAEILHDNLDLEPAQRSEFLGIIIAESERLTRLINDVLDLAKIGSGTMVWHMQEVDLAALVRNAAAATRGLFDDRGIALRLDLAADLPAAFGDRDRLAQIVINLLSNAAKFAPADTGIVRVRLAGQAASQRISVSDNGPGIAAADQEAIFDRFRQVGDTLTRKPGGTGLGLAICRMIADHHGGTIAVASAPDKGATFTLTLPVAQHVAAAAAAVQPR
jgi:signal transduction histidine kinase